MKTYLKQYKCSSCEVICEAVSATHSECPVCGGKIFKIQRKQESVTEKIRNNDNLSKAKVVSFGFADLRPIPAGARVNASECNSQSEKLGIPISIKYNIPKIRQLPIVPYNAKNDDVFASYRQQRGQKIKFYIVLGVLLCMLTLFYASYKLLMN